MHRKKKINLLFMAFLGLIFIFVFSNSVSNVKGFQQTIGSNTAIMDHIYGFPGDKISISFEVISGTPIDVYIYDQRPFVVFSLPKENVVASIEDQITGSLEYTILKLDYHYIVFYNPSASAIDLEYTVIHYPIGIVTTVIIIVIIIPLIVGTILIIRKKYYSDYSKAIKRKQKKVQQDLEDDVNWKKKKKKEKELKKIMDNLSS